jgi:hypothetical protein
MKTKEEVLEYIKRNFALSSGIFLTHLELKLIIDRILKNDKSK